MSTLHLRTPVELLPIVESTVSERNPALDLAHTRTFLTRLKRLMPIYQQKHFREWHTDNKTSYINSTLPTGNVDHGIYISVNSMDYDSSRNFIVGFPWNEKEFVLEFHVGPNDTELFDMFTNIIHANAHGDLIETTEHFKELMEILQDYTDFFEGCEDD